LRHSSDRHCNANYWHQATGIVFRISSPHGHNNAEAWADPILAPRYIVILASHSASTYADFLGLWTGMGGSNDIIRGNDGNFYIACRKTTANPPMSGSATPTGLCSSAPKVAMCIASGSIRAGTFTPY